MPTPVLAYSGVVGVDYAGAPDLSAMPMAGSVQTKGEQPMSAEDNKVLIRRFVEEINRGNVDIVDEVFAPDFKEIALWPDPRVPSSMGTTTGTLAIKEAFPTGRAAVSTHSGAVRC